MQNTAKNTTYGQYLSTDTPNKLLPGVSPDNHKTSVAEDTTKI